MNFVIYNMQLLSSHFMITEVQTHLRHSELSEYFVSPLHKIKVLYCVCKSHFRIWSGATWI